MIDIGQAILELETLNKGFDVPIYEIGVAIKVMKMWRFLKDNFEHPQVKDIINVVEQEFFPTEIHQTIKVNIQGIDDEALHKTKELIRSTKGVSSVWRP